MKVWHKVYAQQFDFDIPTGKRVLLAQFSIRISAEDYAEKVRKQNHTWHVEVVSYSRQAKSLVRIPFDSQVSLQMD